jgi:hypothetical protein
LAGLDAVDYLPAEVRQIDRSKPWWYALALVLVGLSALAAAGAVATRDTAIWLSWIGNVFQAASVTLTLFLVILTYNLFVAASRVNEQNERIHRISQLPLVVADVKPLSLDPYPSYQIEIMNEGSGPALDVDVNLDYRLKSDAGPAASVPFTSSARLRIAVMNKASHSGKLLIDARGIMLAKPWKGLDVERDGAPSAAQSAVLLAPYDLIVWIGYKDLYSQEGHTVYQATQAAGDVGLELTELVAPTVRTGSVVKPIAFSRADPSAPAASAAR